MSAAEAAFLITGAIAIGCLVAILVKFYSDY